MGSMLGLYHFLKLHQFEVSCVSPSSWPDFLDWMPGVNEVLSFDKNPRKSIKAIREAECVFCLDFNDTKRVQDLQGHLDNALGEKYMIDHHLNPQTFADYSWWDTKAIATCELIYDLIYLLDPNALQHMDIATCLYTGIVTDSGSFRFQATTADLHRKVGHMMDLGLKHTYIHEAVQDINTPERLRFLGYCYSEKLRFIENYPIAYITLTYNELKKFGVSTDDTEGLVNQILSVKGIRIAALLSERNQQVKVSFRSKGDIPVNTFAAEHFAGGGHFNAAGGLVSISLEEAELRFLHNISFFNTFLH